MTLSYLVNEGTYYLSPERLAAFGAFCRYATASATVNRDEPTQLFQQVGHVGALPGVPGGLKYGLGGGGARLVNPRCAPGQRAPYALQTLRTKVLSGGKIPCVYMTRTGSESPTTVPSSALQPRR